MDALRNFPAYLDANSHKYSKKAPKALYFISDGSHVKIGSACNPKKRLKQLQTGNPRPLQIIETVDDADYSETTIHHYLKMNNLHEKGEWFCLNENQARWMAGVVFCHSSLYHEKSLIPKAPMNQFDHHEKIYMLRMLKHYQNENALLEAALTEAQDQNMFVSKIVELESEIKFKDERINELLKERMR